MLPLTWRLHSEKPVGLAQRRGVRPTGPAFIPMHVCVVRQRRSGGSQYQHSRKTGGHVCFAAGADHEKRWSTPRRRRFFIRIRASELAYQHSRKTGLLRSLADHEKRWSAPRRRRFSFVSVPASWQINTLEKPGAASQPGQTTKNDGLPYGDGGFLLQADGIHAVFSSSGHFHPQTKESGWGTRKLGDDLIN